MEDLPELMPLLTVASGSMRGARFRLGASPQVIGRASTADIPVDDPHLSRRHASVGLTVGGVMLLDLGSTNGTWLNDCRLDGPEQLTDGDVIRLGRTELRFFDPGLALTDPVGLWVGPLRRNRRPTLPLPLPPPALASTPASFPVDHEVIAHGFGVSRQ
ncbi:FHA domain-containing protein [Micromonospora sp. DT233]|uniref:FHA domain-containing protein n=1 Tax=Micromonospora sp. DT233 TaxID=3393432 RepID=UPI003CE8A439